jgi:hypothetical protein
MKWMFYRDLREEEVLLLLLLPLLLLPLLPFEFPVPLLPLLLCEALPPLAAILLLVSGSIDANPWPEEAPLMLRPDVPDRDELIPLPGPDILLPLPSPVEDLPELERLVRDIEPLPDDEPLLFPDP